MVVRWTPRLERTVQELSRERLSDRTIAVVLRLYEGIDGATPGAVRALRVKRGIAKPSHPAGPYIDPRQTTMSGLDA